MLSRVVRVLVPLLLAAACVERRLLVRTEPEGAEVRVNREEVGASPAAWRFDHYGTVLVEVEHPGYEPASVPVRLSSPWWQKPGLDFVTDVVLPFRIRHTRKVRIRLEERRFLTEEEVEVRLAEVVASARALRDEVGER